MPLSLPVHRLKRAARLAARAKSIPLHAALDHVANAEGYASWSLLAARHTDTTSPQRLHGSLRPGDMVLIAARPRQGKTVLASQLALAAISAGNAAHIFSLDDTPAAIERRLSGLPVSLRRHAGKLAIDCSGAICADHVLTRLADARSGTVAVIDYLQILDQWRTNPPLQQQVDAMARFARLHGVIFVFLCQIDRNYDTANTPMPGPADIRTPNPLDLAVFNRAWFLHNGSLHATDTVAG